MLNEVSVAQLVRESAINAGDLGSIPSWDQDFFPAFFLSNHLNGLGKKGFFHMYPKGWILRGKGIYSRSLSWDSFLEL